MLKSGFAIATVVSFVMAVLPHPPSLPLNPSDKLLHVLAFAALGGLGAAAFPKLPLVRLWLMLTAFGALIEAVQAIPHLHRDSELADLAADAIAALGAGYLVRAGLKRWPMISA